MFTQSDSHSKEGADASKALSHILLGGRELSINIYDLTLVSPSHWAQMMESTLEGTAKEGKKEFSKKHGAAGPSAEGLLQPVKLSREELYKEPTSEELNRLRETESLFHSSLLRLQVPCVAGASLRGPDLRS